MNCIIRNRFVAKPDGYCFKKMQFLFSVRWFYQQGNDNYSVFTVSIWSDHFFFFLCGIVDSAGHVSDGTVDSGSPVNIYSKFGCSSAANGVWPSFPTRGCCGSARVRPPANCPVRFAAASHPARPRRRTCQKTITSATTRYALLQSAAWPWGRRPDLVDWDWRCHAAQLQV